MKVICVFFGCKWSAPLSFISGPETLERRVCLRCGELSVRTSK